MTFSQLVCMVMVGVLCNLCMGMRITWDSRFKKSSRENERTWWRKHGSATFNMGTSHVTAWFTNPIAAQSAWLKSCKNECIKMSIHCKAQAVTEIDKPRSEPCSTPQNGIGQQYIATSKLHVRMTWSITIMSLTTGGHMQDHEINYMSVPDRVGLWPKPKVGVGSVG